jgi:hypothetical protein
VDLSDSVRKVEAGSSDRGNEISVQ